MKRSMTPKWKHHDILEKRKSKRPDKGNGAMHLVRDFRALSMKP